LMKKTQLLAMIILAISVFSCSQTSDNKDLIGKWKMHEIHIKQYNDQMAQIESQIAAFKDSLASAKDSASTKKFQNQLNSYMRYKDNMQARKDSSLKNTIWTFKEGGKLEGQESATNKYKGYWEYNSNSKTLRRFLPSDSVKVDVKGDTMTL